MNEFKCYHRSNEPKTDHNLLFKIDELHLMGTQVLDFQHPGVEGGGIRNAEMLVSSSRLMRPPSTHRSPKKNNNEMKKKKEEKHHLFASSFSSL